LAQVQGTYETYQGSPCSQGILQYDMWNVKPSERWDWANLKQKIARHGIRNSLLTAPMPTASTSQILGNTECFEPYTSNIFSRRVLAGDFVLVNQHLVKDLIERGLWNNQLKEKIIGSGGSVQSIDEIPRDIKELYRTVWEMKQRTMIDMSADRGAFIDQSQSFNVFIADPNFGKLTSMHFYAWNKGLKTGMYYLRTQAAAAPVPVTVSQESMQSVNKKVPVTQSSEAIVKNTADIVCALDNREACQSCSS